MSTSSAPAKPAQTEKPPTEHEVTHSHAVGSPGWAIEQAKSLEQERGALMIRIGANRDFLRNLAKMNALDAEQAKFVTTFYPDKEKGSARSADEVEATRKAREAARKGGA